MQPVKEETVARHEAADQPVGELVQQLSQQTATLVRKEIRLAQLELQEKGKHAGIGAGHVRRQRALSPSTASAC